MAKAKRKKSVDAVEEQPKPTGRKSSRWFLKTIVASTTLLLVLIAAAPTIVMQTPLRDKVLGYALSDLHGTLVIEKLSFGWLTPVEAHDIRLSDSEGHPIINIASLKGDATLLDLLGSPSHLGKLTIDQPHAEITLRDGGSNLEDVLADYLNKPSSSSSSTISCSVEMTNGMVTINDTQAQRQFQIQDFNLAATLPASANQAIELKTSGRVVERGGAASPFAVNLASGRLTTKITDFPLAMMQPVARRFVSGMQLDGRLQSDLTCQWGETSGKDRRSVDGQIVVQQLVTSGEWSGGEQLRLAEVSVPCHVTWEGDQLNISQFEAGCDVGRIVCQGTIDDPLQWKDYSWRDVVAGISHGNAQVAGEVDLARLTQLMPNTLRIRDGAQIVSGVVNAQLSSQANGAGATWQGRIESGRVVAVYQGRELDWDKPLLITVLGHHDNNGMTLDRLGCQADFMQITGSGTAEEFQLDGTYDLGRLAQEAGKLINLDNTRMAGLGTVKAGWQGRPGAAFSAGGEMQVNGFELAQAGSTPWTERQLILSAAADGTLDADRAVTQVRAGQVSLVSGGDSMTASLTKSVDKPSASSVWPLEIRLAGQMATWLRRLTPVLGPLEGYDIAGRTEWTTLATYSTAGVKIDQSDLLVQPLHVFGHGWYIDDPAARAHFVGNWVSSASRLDVQEATLETAAISAQLREAVLAMASESARQMRGNLTFNGDVAKLSRWMMDPRVQPAIQYAGKLAGKGSIADSAGKTTATLDSTIENFVAAPTEGQPWTEPVVHLVTQAEYDKARDQFDLKQMQLQSRAAEIQATGQVVDVANRRMTHAEGTLNYDLAEVQKLLQPYLGSGVQLAGRESRAFSFSGPLVAPTNVPVEQQHEAWMQQLSGRAELGWEGMNLYGVPFGRGSLQSELRNGVATFSPLDAMIGKGRIHVQPQVRLSPGPAEFQIQPGQVLEQVDVTPDVSNRVLMYVAPVLAGAVQPSGKVSMAIDSCRVPLDAPKTADIIGRLQVHSLEVSPGPLMQEMSTLLDHAGTAKVKDNSEISFRMIQGRVYHQGLELNFPAATVRTQGSVGLDQTLAILVQIPIPSKWLGGMPLTDSLKSQSIQVPIGGTLAQPRIDRDELGRLSGQFIRQATQNAAESALRNGVNQGLDQLFGPLK
jgi:hypothetical protein